MFRFHTRRGDRRYRAPHCNRCHVIQERERKQGKKRAADNRFLASHWGRLANAKEQRRSVVRLVVELLERFGGHAGLAKAWHGAYVEATTPTKKLRAIHATMGMMRWLNETSMIEAGMDEKTAAELEEDLQNTEIQVIAEAIRTRPELVQAIAAPLGYELAKAS